MVIKLVLPDSLKSKHASEEIFEVDLAELDKMFKEGQYLNSAYFIPLFRFFADLHPVRTIPFFPVVLATIIRVFNLDENHNQDGGKSIHEDFPLDTDIWDFFDEVEVRKTIRDDYVAIFSDYVEKARKEDEKLSDPTKRRTDAQLKLSFTYAMEALISTIVKKKNKDEIRFRILIKGKKVEDAEKQGSEVDNFITAINDLDFPQNSPLFPKQLTCELLDVKEFLNEIRQGGKVLDDAVDKMIRTFERSRITELASIGLALLVFVKLMHLANQRNGKFPEGMHLAQLRMTSMHQVASGGKIGTTCDYSYEIRYPKKTLSNPGPPEYDEGKPYWTEFLEVCTSQGQRNVVYLAKRAVNFVNNQLKLKGIDLSADYDEMIIAGVSFQPEPRVQFMRVETNLLKEIAKCFQMWQDEVLKRA